MGYASECHRTGISGRCGEECEVYMIYEECGYLEEWRDDVMQVKRTGNKVHFDDPVIPEGAGIGYNIMKSVSGLLGLKTLVYNPTERTFDSPSYAFTWPNNAPMEATCNFKCENVVLDDCNSDPGCGLYASLYTDVSIGGYARTDNHIIALMEGFGWVAMGENGFASAKGRIVGVVNLDRLGNAITPEQERMGKQNASNLAAMMYFNVQMYSLQEAETLMTYLWAKSYKLHTTPVPYKMEAVYNAIKERMNQ